MTAVRCWLAGFGDLENALAHLVLGARASAGADAPSYVRERVIDWLEVLFTDEALDTLADELADEAMTVRTRIQRRAA